MISILKKELDCVCTYDDWCIVHYANYYYVINEEGIQEVTLVRQESSDNLEAVESYLDWSCDFVGESDDCQYLLGFDRVANRMTTIAHNAIILGELDYKYGHQSLLRELGCSEKEFETIMG